MRHATAADRPRIWALNDIPNVGATSMLGGSTFMRVDEKRVRTIEELEKLPLAERHRIVNESIVTDLSTLPPEFVARIRRRGRELLEARGIALPPEE